MSLQISDFNFVWVGIAILAGALVPFQTGSNATLGHSLGHPLWASLASLLVSILVLLPLILALRIPAPALGQLALLPAWTWLGGVAGIFFISTALWLAPKTGVTNFIACVIAGQMLASLLIDHFGLINMPVKATNIGRIGGVLLLLAGMLMVQWFTPAYATPGTAPELPGERTAHQDRARG